MAAAHNSCRGKPRPYLAGGSLSFKGLEKELFGGSHSVVNLSIFKDRWSEVENSVDSSRLLQDLQTDSQPQAERRCLSIPEIAFNRSVAANRDSLQKAHSCGEKLNSVRTDAKSVVRGDHCSH